MDECGVSQQVMQENPNSFFFLNTHCEIYSKEAFDGTNELFIEVFKPQPTYFGTQK